GFRSAGSPPHGGGKGGGSLGPRGGHASRGGPGSDGGVVLPAELAHGGPGSGDVGSRTRRAHGDPSLRLGGRVGRPCRGTSDPGGTRAGSEVLGAAGVGASDHA